MSKERPIFGIDVHPEYQRGLNFERARAEDFEFCMIKASEGPYRDGDRYVPSGFKQFFRRAEKEGFVMGAYHFLVATPPKAQAEHFLRTIEAVGGPEDKILMVDFEEHPNRALTPGNEHLDGFVAELRRRVGDHPIVIYAGKGFWTGGHPSGDFDRYGADVAWDAYYLHMNPIYPRRFYGDSEHMFHRAGLPWGWGRRWGEVEPWFWQFTSAGKVAGLNIDVNAYRGTREQLLRLTGFEDRDEAGDGRREHQGHAGRPDDREERRGRDERDRHEHGRDDREEHGGGGAGHERRRGARRKLLEHGVVDGTRFALGFKYVMQLNNHMKYWVWSSGSVPDGEGAYASNRPLPPAKQLKGQRIFCAGVPNLFRRAAGKSIPTRGNALYDGGVAAYFYTSAFGGLGPGFFSGVDVKFDLARAKKWARETRSGVLIGRHFRGNTLAGQGHVAILLPDGKVLQSFQFGANGEPGLNTDFTIEKSNAGHFYEIMAHPEAWIDHNKNQLRDVEPDREEPAEDDERHPDHGRPDRERESEHHKDGRDDHPDRPRPRDDLDVDGELEEIDPADLGREILEIIRGYARRANASHERERH
jgi:GH25 family lysozyme M1 (1,4-beta-N-acetylmuramidase)